MTTEELAKLKAKYPKSMEVWYDNMLRLDPAKLVETVLFHMEPGLLEMSLLSIATCNLENDHDKSSD